MARRKKNKPSKAAITAFGVVGLYALGSAVGDTEAPAATSSKASLSLPAQRAQQAYKAGWPKGELPTVVAIGFAESQLDNNAHHCNSDGSCDDCWLQDNSKNKRLFKGDSPSNPVGCARIAKRIHDEQGYKAWSTVNNGAYLKFMSKGRAAVAEAGLS